MAFESLLAVVTPAPSRDLTTLATVAQECRCSVEDLTDGLELIAAASDAIVAFTKREWVSEAVRQTFRGNGRRVLSLFLDRAPLTTLTSVTVDGSALNLATEVEYDARRGLLYRLDLDERVEWGCRLVVVEYTAGYTPPSVASCTMPALIQRIAAKTVAGWRSGQGSNTRVRSRTIEDVGSVSFVDPKADDAGFPPGIADMLRPHQWKRAG